MNTQWGLHPPFENKMAFCSGLFPGLPPAPPPLVPLRVWLLQRALSWPCVASPFVLQRSVKNKGAVSATLKWSHLNWTSKLLHLNWRVCLSMCHFGGGGRKECLDQQILKHCNYKVNCDYNFKYFRSL